MTSAKITIATIIDISSLADVLSTSWDAGGGLLIVIILWLIDPICCK